MFVALTTLTLRPRVELPTAEAPASAPSLCYELLIPYLDPQESSEKGMPADTRHALVVKVWAPDVAHAVAMGRERFRDYRFRHRTARITSEGPIPMRVVREENE